MGCPGAASGRSDVGRGNVSHFSRADITGPIVLQTYRAIADYEKSSRSEMALKAGDMVDVVEKSESGMCPSSGEPPGATPLPGHHFSRDRDNSCPNTAHELVTAAYGLEGRWWSRGLLEERRGSEQVPQQHKPLSASRSLGSCFTFTWSHMTVGFAWEGCGAILENQATSSHASAFGVSCPGGNRANWPSFLVAPCKQRLALVPSLPSSHTVGACAYPSRDRPGAGVPMVSPQPLSLQAGGSAR